VEPAGVGPTRPTIPISRKSCLGCLGLGIFLLGIGVLAVVPHLVMEAPAKRLPGWVLRWRNGGGVEIASGTIAGKPWWVHAAKRSPGGVGRRLLCVYFLHYDAEIVTRACVGDPIKSARPGSYGSSYELPGHRGRIVFEAVPKRVAIVHLTVARYPRTATFDVYHPAGPRPVTRTLEARTIARPALPNRYWVLVTPPGFDVPPRGAVVYLDASGHRL